jgi:hypothetical protein
VLRNVAASKLRVATKRIVISVARILKEGEDKTGFHFPQVTGSGVECVKIRILRPAYLLAANFREVAVLGSEMLALSAHQTALIPDTTVRYTRS